MDKEKIIVIALIILVLLAVLYSTGAINLNFGKKAGNTGGNYENIPQECRPPAGQDIEAWKTHLGHHENTKYCLEYFK